MKLRCLPWIIIIGSAIAGFGQSNCPQALKLHIRECSGETAQALLRAGIGCDMVNRLFSFEQWLESIGKPCSTIVEDVRTRYAYFEDTVRFPIDYSGLAFKGAAKARVKIVAYVSMSCPLCKRLYRDLTDSLTSPRTRAIALAVKPFSTTPLDRALVAARKWKKQPELLLAVAPIQERITIETVMHIADSLRIPLPDFKKEIEDGRTLSIAESSRAEAIKNGVTLTPTFFINGKRYRGYKDARWVIDAAQYEATHQP